MKDLYDFKWGYLFAVWLFFYCFNAYVTNNFILNNDWYYNVLGAQISEEKVQKIVSLKEKLNWIGYIIIPIFILLKWSLVASLLYGGMFFTDTPCRFLDCFKITIIAEFAIGLGILVKTTYFIVSNQRDIQTVKYFFPLSVSNFVDVNKMPYLSYLFQQANLFELLYWLLLVLGISASANKKIKESLRIVAISYVTPFCCWILLVTYFQLQLS